MTQTEEFKDISKIVNVIKALSVTKSFWGETETSECWISTYPDAFRILLDLILSKFFKRDYEILPIAYSYLYSFTRKGEQKELELHALLDVVTSFKEFKEVKSIYCQKYREEIQIYILLLIDKYDEDLFDKLIRTEYKVRKRHQNLIFEFFYLPAGIIKKEDFIHPKAQCIFAR